MNRFNELKTYEIYLLFNLLFNINVKFKSLYLLINMYILYWKNASLFYINDTHTNYETF